METKKAWVDFKLIKSLVTMEMLIAQYSITGFVRNGDDLRGVCPIHQGKSKREFSINLVENTFCCFAPSCKARGNVLDFVAKMERCTVREAALKLDEWFKITEQEVGESAQQVATGSLGEAGTVAALIAEIEAHLARSLHHTTLAEAKLTDLKGFLAAR